METGKRREFSAKEKMAIVLEGLTKESSVSEVCRRHGISPVQYYAWRDQMVSSSEKIFNKKRGRKDRSEERHKAEIERLNGVIAEITAENLAFKKKTWRPL